jgi:hypothetical protein
LQTAGFFLIANKNRISTTIKNVATTQIQLTVENLKVVSEVNTNVCSVKIEQFGGCYRCHTGAKLELICSTDFGQAMALVTCDENQFMVNCDNSGQRTTTTLAFVSAIINVDCSVQCPGGRTHVLLEGVLAFAGNEDASQIGNPVAKAVLVNDGIGFPAFPGTDIFNALFLADWKLLLGGALGIVALIFLGPSSLSGLCLLFRLRQFTGQGQPIMQHERKNV